MPYTIALCDAAEIDPTYLTKSERFKPVISRRLIGDVWHNEAAQTSSFIVRIGYRKERIADVLQGMSRKKSAEGRIYKRRFYTHSHYAWAIATVSWLDGHVTESSEFSTPNEATAQLRAKRLPYCAACYHK